MFKTLEGAPALPAAPTLMQVVGMYCRVGKTLKNSHPETSPNDVCSIGRFSDHSIMKARAA